MIGDHIKVLIKEVKQVNNVTFMMMKGEGIEIRMSIEPKVLAEVGGIFLDELKIGPSTMAACEGHKIKIEFKG